MDSHLLKTLLDVDQEVDGESELVADSLDVLEDLFDFLLCHLLLRLEPGDQVVVFALEDCFVDFLDLLQLLVDALLDALCFGGPVCFDGLVDLLDDVVVCEDLLDLGVDFKGADADELGGDVVVEVA